MGISSCKYQNGCLSPWLDFLGENGFLFQYQENSKFWAADSLWEIMQKKQCEEDSEEKDVICAIVDETEATRCCDLEKELEDAARCLAGYKFTDKINQQR